MLRSEKQIVLLAGGTGLVGGQILQLLADDDRIAEVRALVRRSMPAAAKGPRIRECIIDFEHLQNHQDLFDVDIVFSALGTTIHQARSKEAFRRVDFDYPLAIAKAARAAGARHFLLVSALGANSRSNFFYNRVKGELEEAILALNYPSVTIARPSMLLGERPEPRVGEQLAKKIAWLAPGAWAPVHASQVASALAKAAREARQGVQILDNTQMRSRV